LVLCSRTNKRKPHAILWAAKKRANAGFQGCARRADFAQHGSFCPTQNALRKNFFTAKSREIRVKNLVRGLLRLSAEHRRIFL
jgi:hypothetical protein